MMSMVAQLADDIETGKIRGVSSPPMLGKTFNGNVAGPPNPHGSTTLLAITIAIRRTLYTIPTRP